jgi:hypothetical protein
VNRVRSLLVLAAAVAVVSCAAPPAAKTPVAAAPPTPTPGLMSRSNPNIVEEDEFHFVERLPRDEYIRVDERHIRHPIVGPAVEFYKEDDKYYYVYTNKRNAETEALEKALRAAQTPTPASALAPPPITPTPAGPALSEFEDITPVREPGRLRLEPVASTGLPSSGLWRASFIVRDFNGDGILDIIAPPSRLGDAKLHIWIGDGKGGFSALPVQFVEDGQPDPAFSIDYGAVAVGDIDGDGNLDIVTASHSAGLVSLFGDGKGTFRVLRTGLPKRDYSAQAIALADADGDGKLDIIASADSVAGRSDAPDAVRVYLYKGNRWRYKEDGIEGGFYSNCLHAWDFDKDGKADILTASHFIGALTLLWKNLGDGRFEPVRFPALEIYSYHFATVPGTFGRQRAAAFADAYQMITNDPQEARATGISMYSYENGNWTRHRVWRKKNGQSTQYALAVGDLDGDGLDDVVFADSELNRLRVFFQKPDGTFSEMAEQEEPVLDSVGQWIELADVNRDGRLDIILSKTVASYRVGDQGGWNVYLNRR